MMRDYASLKGLHEKVFAESGNLFQKECSLAEEAISSSFSAYSALAPEAAKDKRLSHLLALFYRNTVYLSAAYNLIRRGMLDPAGNNMRTVFETIIWQYAYLTDEQTFKDSMALESLEEQKLALVKTKGWSNTKERSLQNLRRKHSFQKAMKKMYSKEAYERSFFNQYWALCQKSHTSIFGASLNTPTMEMGTTLEKAPGEIKGNMSALLYLCSENLICFLNCFWNLMDQDGIDAALELVNRINESIPPAHTLAPDTKELEFRLRFKEV
ncbi:MAG: DUF5677 domain-containing protein [Candidatus Micrarchaeota archaeon]